MDIVKWLNKPIREKALSLSYKWHRYENMVFEKLYNLDFHGDVTSKDLVADSKWSLENACDYHPYGNPAFRHLIDEALMCKANGFRRFIDIGCGKGKPCIYAAHYFGSQFKEIVGIDFSQPLVEIAQKNVLQYGRQDLHIICSDALEYKIPDGDNLIFMFNPFNNKILDGFIANNIDHFEANDSVIAYANDLHRDVLDRFGFRVAHRSHRDKNSIFVYARRKPIQC